MEISRRQIIAAGASAASAFATKAIAQSFSFSAGCGDGVVGAGAGFGGRFLDFALLAGFAIFIPFFFRAGAPRFVFSDFFATFNIPIKIMPRLTATCFLT